MDALFLSRIQFAWLIAFHILLPAFTVGLSCYVATLEIRYWRGKDETIRRLSAFWWAHALSAVLVALGTVLSSFWILAVNSWMQTPAGYEIVDGRFFPLSLSAVIFTPSFPC